MINKFTVFIFIFVIVTINIQLQCGDILTIKNKFPQKTEITILTQSQNQQLRKREIALFPGEYRIIYLEGHDDRFIGYQTTNHKITYEQNQEFLHYFLYLNPSDINYLQFVQLI